MISTEPGVIFYVYVHGLDATLDEDGGRGQQGRARSRIWKATSGSRRSSIQPAT